MWWSDRLEQLRREQDPRRYPTPQPQPFLRLPEPPPEPPPDPEPEDESRGVVEIDL